MHWSQLIGISGLLVFAAGVGGDARADAGKVVLRDGADGEALVLGLADANPHAVTCAWIAEGRGSRAAVGKVALEGRVTCDAKVVGPRIAGRTRASRILLRAESGTLVAIDHYGEAGAFYGRGTRRSTGLGIPAASLWEMLREPTTVLVMPGAVTLLPELPPDPSCAGQAELTTEELVQTLQTARERMDHCWPRNAPPSAFTFDVVSDRTGQAQPKLVASLRKEPKVASCLLSALAWVKFDPERARCHQVDIQWPVNSRP
ncbi:MAG: hypothetical protein U1F43_13130 [Myxococcota bacterium]